MVNKSDFSIRQNSECKINFFKLNWRVPIGGGGWAGLPGRQGEVLEQHQVELSTLNTTYDSRV
jgi:hypothetical protein